MKKIMLIVLIKVTISSWYFHSIVTYHQSISCSLTTKPNQTTTERVISYFDFSLCNPHLGCGTLSAVLSCSQGHLFLFFLKNLSLFSVSYHRTLFLFIRKKPQVYRF